MTLRRIRAIAGADVPHGGYCRLAGRKAFPQAEADGSGGICAGPAPISGFTPRGKALELQTDGGVMTADGWVELSGGRIVR